MSGSPTPEAAGDSPTPPRSPEAEIPTADGVARKAAFGALRPESIGRYTILRPLGAGGMGVVFEAFDPELDRRVAVKLLRPGRGGARAQARLVREAQALARLSHPNVVQVHDTGVDGNRVFLAMELVAGPTLKHWLASTPRSWRDVLVKFVEAGRGLEAAHNAGMVHRDFKPSNVIVPDDGPVRVVDFGLASSAAAEDLEPGQGPVIRPLPGDPALTNTGAAVGTPIYMAPEQHAGRRVDAAADQFSFCVALFEGLYGNRPFGGTDSYSLATAVLDGELEEPGKFQGPGYVLVALRRGLSADAADRFDSMGGLLAELEREPGRARRRWVAVGGLGLVALTSGGVVFALTASDACTAEPPALRAAWGPDNRAGLEQAYGQAGLEDLGERVTEALDDYASVWGRAHQEACETHRDGSRSDRALDAQMVCLEAGLARVDQVVSYLSEDSSQSLEAGMLGVAQLPLPRTCLEESVLLVQSELVGDPNTDRALATVRSGVARAETLRDLGRVGEAEAVLVGLEQAGASREPPVPAAAAEVQLALGILEIERNDFGAASLALDRAASLALRADADHLLAQALVRTGFVDSMTIGRPGRALDQAEAIVERQGASQSLRALLESNRGIAHAMKGDLGLARARFAEAVRLSEDAQLVDAFERSSYRSNLALATESAAERVGLLASVYEELARVLGPSSPRTVNALVSLGRYDDDPRAGLEALIAGCALRAGVDPGRVDEIAWCALDVAALQDELGDSGAASETLRSVPGAPDAARTGSSELGLISLAGAYLALLTGEPTLALAAVEDARSQLWTERAGLSRELAEVARIEALALRELGRLPEAKPALEGALVAYEEGQKTSFARAWRVRADQVRALLAEIPD